MQADIEINGNESVRRKESVRGKEFSPQADFAVVDA